MINRLSHKVLSFKTSHKIVTSSLRLRTLGAGLGMATFLFSGQGLAESLRRSALLYENPFDLSAGGASLTRSTQEGVLFSNPSLPALGPGVLRWIYSRTSIHFGADAIDLAKDSYEKKKAGNLKVDSELIENVLKTPIHIGNDLNLGFITAFSGIGIFQCSRTDIQGRQYGSVGLPEIRTRAEAAAGLATFAAMPVGETVALGVSLKPLYAAESFENISLSDFSGSGTRQLLSDLKNNTQYGLGVSTGFGATVQFRSVNFDLRFAATIDDVGQTKFNNPDVEPWKQITNLGVGLIPHTRSNAVHCAFDLRDIEAKYGEHWTRRSRAGCKVLFRSRIGVGAGYYQGWPSYGVVLNLMFLRLEAGSYTREFGREAGTNGRRVYFLATGFEMP